MWSFPVSSCWDNTAPKPCKEALVSSTNSLLKSEYPRTGAVTKASLSASNACWCSSVYLNSFVLVISVDAASFPFF